jgi:hypothetical protein
MSYSHRIVALVSGILLCLVSIYIVGEGLIEFPWDHYYPKYHTHYYQFIQPISTVALVIVSFAWSWITLRWLTRPPKVTVWWCFGGLVVGFACSELIAAVQAYHWCLDWHAEEYRQFHSQPWYRSPPECPSVLANFRDNLVDGSATSSFLAIISGLAAAAAIALRSERTSDGGKLPLFLKSAPSFWILSAIAVGSLSWNYMVWRDSVRSAVEAGQTIRNLDSQIAGQLGFLQSLARITPHSREAVGSEILQVTLPDPRYSLPASLIELRGLVPESQRQSIDAAIYGTGWLCLFADRLAPRGGDISDSERNQLAGILQKYFNDIRWTPDSLRSATTRRLGRDAASPVQTFWASTNAGTPYANGARRVR